MTPHLILIGLSLKGDAPKPKSKNIICSLSTYKPEQCSCDCSLLLSLKAKSYHGQIQRFLVMFRVSTEQWFLEDQRFLILDDSRCFRESQKHTTQQHTHTQKTTNNEQRTKTLFVCKRVLVSLRYRVWHTHTQYFRDNVEITFLIISRHSFDATIFPCFRWKTASHRRPRQWHQVWTRIWINPTRIVCNQNNWKSQQVTLKIHMLCKYMQVESSIVCHVNCFGRWFVSLDSVCVHATSVGSKLDISLTKSKWVETCIYIYKYVCIGMLFSLFEALFQPIWKLLVKLDSAGESPIDEGANITNESWIQTTEVPWHPCLVISLEPSDAPVATHPFGIHRWVCWRRNLRANFGASGNLQVYTNSVSRNPYKKTRGEVINVL